MGVSDAYGSYRSYRSSLGIHKFFADVYDIILGIAGCENYRTTYCDLCSDKWGGKDVLVVDQGRVNLPECHICSSLPFRIGFFMLDPSCTIAASITEVTGYLSFGLWVFGGDEFRYGSFGLLAPV